ncbi:MAG: efflux RND transporter periplasmic adaptor subunit [Thermodesulfobacteriota bacterium]
MLPARPPFRRGPAAPTWWTAVPVLFLLLLLAACRGDRTTRSAAPQEAKPARPPVPVRVETAQSEDVPVTLSAVGAVEAKASVAVKSRIMGELREVLFQEGDVVRQGQILFRIDPAPYQAALTQAEALLARDQALARKATRDACRYAELLRQGLVSADKGEDVASQAEALAAQVQADQAAVAKARLELEYCTIAAPLSGRTGSLLVHRGNLVKANDDQPLVKINQVQPVQVTFAVPEGRLARIRARLAAGPVTVRITVAGQEPTETGRLLFVDHAVDQATATVTMKAEVANDHGRLWPGQFVQVELVMETLAGAVVVPAPAVQTGQAGDYLFVVQEDGTVALRPVRLALTTGGRAVLAEGLASGEEVVTDGAARLTPGARVEVLAPDAAGAPSAR